LARQPQALVSGVDIDEARVRDCAAIANKTCRGNLGFFVGSGHDALRRFDPGSFDSALAVEVLQYVKNPLLTLKELCRILTPGGCIVGHVPTLGYLREHEQTLFDDLNLPAMLRDSGFEDISITETFGDSVRQLCRVFEWLSSSWILTALAFPFLLMASSMCGVASPGGDYRLFVARKSLSAAKAGEDGPFPHSEKRNHSPACNNLLRGHGPAGQFGPLAAWRNESEHV
jgi:SAM-dependent methyltransferase